MGLVLGTNCGFVTVAPVDAPATGVGVTMDTVAWVFRDTSPLTAGKITEVGWYCQDATEEANFEVGLYAADGAVVPGEAGTRLFVAATNAKGTTAGWKSVAVDWTISPNTSYWLGVQLDDTATRTDTEIGTVTGAARDTLTGQTSLPNPFGGGAFTSNGGIAIYAVWEATGTNTKINIGDSWKDITAMKINIGDAWKDVSSVKVNIGDVWKTVF